MTGIQHFTPLPDELKLLGFDAADVKKIVIGHAHWDHAGQLLDFPNATLYVQREELRGDRVGTELPEPAHQRREQYPWRLLPLAGLRL